MASSTQNPALAAFLFHDREVLQKELPGRDGMVRAIRPARVPVVLTESEVRALLARLDGTRGLAASVLYGIGMPLLQGLRLRVGDADFERREITLRDGKGGRDSAGILLPLRACPASTVGLHCPAWLKAVPQQVSDIAAVSTAKGADLFSRARELVPAFRKRAAEAEKRRRIPDESMAELRSAGLLRTLQPALFGGHELPLDEAVLISATVAEGCGSTGWIQGIFSDHCATLGMFDGRAQQDVWGASPDSLVSSGFLPAGNAERVDGGYRLSGRWPFSSGCDHADWALVRSFVPAAASAEPAELFMFLVPKSDYTIIDNWHVMGMSATGSKDIELRGVVFVPAHRALSDRDLRNGTGPGSGFNGGALYRLPRHATVPFSLAAPLLGMAERALQLTVQNMRERSSGERRAAHEGAIHVRVAEAAAGIDAARALMLRDCREAMEIVARGGQLDLGQRARNRRDIAYVAAQCTHAIDRLYATAGARSIYLGGEAQRLLRDAHAASQHMALNWDAAGSTWGRVAAGLPPRDGYLRGHMNWVTRCVVTPLTVTAGAAITAPAPARPLSGPADSPDPAVSARRPARAVRRAAPARGREVEAGGEERRDQGGGLTTRPSSCFPPRRAPGNPETLPRAHPRAAPTRRRGSRPRRGRPA